MATAAGLGVVFCNDPSTAKFFPSCFFHSLTGLYCPGCGSTRALHALLHGDLVAAIRFNPLFVVAGFPALTYAIATHAVRLLRPSIAISAVRVRLGLTFAIPILALVFTVLRNIPTRPFCYLAPHTVVKSASALRTPSEGGSRP
jgi:hypothetical protein